MGSKLVINYKTKKSNDTRPPQIDRDCWFCYDNNIDRHLIFHESQNFYCALPKGPICDDHYLIVPKTHIGNQVEIYQKEQMEELNEIKKMVISHLKEKKMNFLIFERFIPFKFQKAVHLNLQIIGFPYEFGFEDNIMKLSKLFLDQNSSRKKTEGKNE